jgi:HEPN domain-containing protein
MRDERGEAERWLRQAENDLEFGRLALREGYFAQACFIAQQTAEKGVKAIAYGAGHRTVLGHSLVELTDRQREQVPDLASLREIAGILDQYYVPTRYPERARGRSAVRGVWGATGTGGHRWGGEVLGVGEAGGRETA